MNICVAPITSGLGMSRKLHETKLELELYRVN